MRDLCAKVDIGITSADYALADTGTLVMLSSPREARMVSLLSPAHIAVVESGRNLTGLTAPSRTADIEQILVRGVHGPGQITVIVVG